MILLQKESQGQESFEACSEVDQVAFLTQDRHRKPRRPHRQSNGKKAQKTGAEGNGSSNVHPLNLYKRKYIHIGCCFLN